MGRQAKLKQERKKKYYLDKIKNSPLGKLADYQLLSQALDIRPLQKIFDLMDNFNQDLCLSDEASFYFHNVIEKISIQKVQESTTISDRTIWTDFPLRCLENARGLHIINTYYETGFVPSVIEKEWGRKSYTINSSFHKRQSIYPFYLVLGLRYLIPLRERTKVPLPWRKGEVCMILVKENPELRGKGGCWAVITEVHDFSCTVSLWDGDYQVKPENLKELPYSNEQQEAVRKLSERLSKLYDPEMEETAKGFRDQRCFARAEARPLLKMNLALHE